MKAEPEPEPDVAVASMEDNLATFLGALLQPVGSYCKQISTPQLEIVVANMEGASCKHYAVSRQHNAHDDDLVFLVYYPM